MKILSILTFAIICHTQAYSSECEELIQEIILKRASYLSSIDKLTESIEQAGYKSSDEEAALAELLGHWEDRAIDNLEKIEEYKNFRMSKKKKKLLKVKRFYEIREKIDSMATLLLEVIDQKMEIRNTPINASGSLKKMISDIRDNILEDQSRSINKNLEDLIELTSTPHLTGKELALTESSIIETKKNNDKLKDLYFKNLSRAEKNKTSSSLKVSKSYQKLFNALPREIQLKQNFFLTEALASKTLHELKIKFPTATGFRATKDSLPEHTQLLHAHITGKDCYIVIWVSRRSGDHNNIEPLWIGMHKDSPYEKNAKKFHAWVQGKMVSP